MNKDLLTKRLEHAKNATKALEEEYTATVQAISELNLVEQKQRELLIMYKARVGLLEELITHEDTD